MPVYENVLCRQALSKDGIQIAKLKLKLLCDDDIIVYLKNISDSDIGKQYFDRSSRLVPMWKNEIFVSTDIDTGEKFFYVYTSRKNKEC